jgi:hypothetical protein
VHSKGVSVQWLRSSTAVDETSPYANYEHFITMQSIHLLYCYNVF